MIKLLESKFWLWKLIKCLEKLLPGNVRIKKQLKRSWKMHGWIRIQTFWRNNYFKTSFNIIVSNICRARRNTHNNKYKTPNIWKFLINKCACNLQPWKSVLFSKKRNYKLRNKASEIKDFNSKLSLRIKKNTTQ